MLDFGRDICNDLPSISEIYDGDAPSSPRGCIAQAWSVAEVLRAWTIIQGQESAMAETLQAELDAKRGDRSP